MAGRLRPLTVCCVGDGPLDGDGVRDSSAVCQLSLASCRKDLAVHRLALLATMVFFVALASALPLLVALALALGQAAVLVVAALGRLAVMLRVVADANTSDLVTTALVLVRG